MNIKELGDSFLKIPKMYFFFIGIIAILLLGLFTANSQAEKKDNVIANLTANLTKYTQMRSWIDDYNVYGEICNRMQNDKADILAKQCTAQGFSFISYYVSYPSKDFLITCQDSSGKVQVMRFRA